MFKSKKKVTKESVKEVSTIKNVPVVETIKRQYENYTFNVKIDYKNGRISIVDDYGQPSVFQFANRGIEYMAGWKEILSNLSELTSFAEAKLKAYQDEVKAEHDKHIAKAFEMRNEMLGAMFGLK